MKRLKKTLAVILTLCMMMSCVSVTAFATGTDASEKDQTATEETNVQILKKMRTKKQSFQVILKKKMTR